MFTCVLVDPLSRQKIKTFPITQNKLEDIM